MKRILAVLILVAAAAATEAQEAVEVDEEPRVRVETNLGDFIIQLDRVRAPLTVDHFLQYVSEGFYEGLIFHRVVAGFIAQAGGFTPDMEQRTAERTVFNESGNGLGNVRGSVAMARTGEPHSATSQFYINLVDNQQILNPVPSRWGYAVFGKVVDGMEVVDQIGHTATGAGGPFDRSVPADPIIIERIVRLHD